MKNSLSKIFNKDKNIIIGAIHFPPLFGYKDFPGYKIALENATQDLRALENGGVDGIIIENNYDIPHKFKVEKGTIDMMITLGKKLKDKTKLPIGVDVLWNDCEAALLIAKEIGGKFIRVAVFVDKVKTTYGEIFGDPKGVLDFRKKIKAENVALFTDIQVKHAIMMEEKTIKESAKQAIKAGSDVIIVTGKWTGEAPDLSDLKKVRKTVGDFPVLVGSGTDKRNIKELFEYADGAIVSTSLKEGEAVKGEANIKTWEQRINEDKAKELVQEAKFLRD